jgi:hypothetical protein
MLLSHSIEEIHPGYGMISLFENGGAASETIATE